MNECYIMLRNQATVANVIQFDWIVKAWGENMLEVECEFKIRNQNLILPITFKTQQKRVYIE